MKICGAVLAILYVGLMMFAVYKEKLKNTSSAFIVIGCLLVLLYTLLNMVWCKNFIIIMIIGMVNISVGTFMNGFKQNNIHIHHHVIRLIVETIITTINEQILKFAQNYPTNFKTASSDAPFFMNWCRLPIRSVLT